MELRRAQPIDLETLSGRPRGGVVTQRTANPCTPVRFRARPPNFPALSDASARMLVQGVAGALCCAAHIAFWRRLEQKAVTGERVR